MYILIVEPWHTTLAIEQMWKTNIHVNHLQIKILIFSVEIGQFMRVFVLSIC